MQTLYFHHVFVVRASALPFCSLPHLTVVFSPFRNLASVVSSLTTKCQSAALMSDGERQRNAFVMRKYQNKIPAKTQENKQKGRKECCYPIILIPVFVLNILNL